MEIVPVGVVHCDADGQSTIEVFPQYAEALKGIDGSCSVQVLYWMHRLSDPDRRGLLVHPHGDTARPKKGVFAVRSPVRPNPIGSSVVEVVRRRENHLVVRGLDALDGSPVIDIKGD